MRTSVGCGATAGLLRGTVRGAAAAGEHVCVLWYIGTNIVRKTSASAAKSRTADLEVERVQTGVRMERRLLKVLKALAEYLDMSLGDLLEGVVLHAFDGKTPFTAQTLRKISELKSIYELDLDARSSHRLREKA